EIEPYRTHRLKVDPPHELYVEESGNAAGVPALFLHGGPGGGTKPVQRRTFDPERFRIILFDQRGAGRSTPSAELAGNTTADLIADIERIREHLGIDAWLVTGGSWGSCLSLAYAIAHPQRCLGLRLHGIFLSTPEEIHFWFHGIGRFFPDHFEAFVAPIPHDERDDLLGAYYRRLIDPDPAVHMPAAQALRGYSARTQTLLPSDAHISALTEPKTALEISRIFTHYCMNRAFLPEGHLLEGVAALDHLPCEIVQGRYDVVTPMQSAWKLHRAWPQARFTVVDLANHVPTPEAPALSKALRDATDRLADRLSADPAPTIEQYLAPRADSAPAVSPDGEQLAWISDRSGVGQIWSMTLAGGSPAQRLVTPERVGSIAFHPKSNDLIYTMDCGGDERHQLWLLPADAKEARPLTDAPGVVHAWGTWDREGGRVAYASNARDARHMDVYVRSIDAPEAECVLEGEGWRKPLSFFPDGNSLLIQDNRRSMWDADLVRLDLATGETSLLLPAEGKARYATAKWAKDGSGIYLLTNRGRDYDGLSWLDIGSGELSWLATPEGDIELLAVAPDEQQQAYVVNVDGYGQLCLRDVASGEVETLDVLPPGRPTSLLYSPDGAALIVALERFTAPPSIWRIDLPGRSAAQLVGSPVALAEDDRVEPSIVSVPSFDGRDVPAFVFEPKSDLPAEGRPALVIVHGGPESQYAAHWRSDVQYLVRRGWTVVAPNVRGSTGYGREWQSLDDRRLRMDSVKDLKAVRDWLAARPDVDASRLAVYGQSYGGFMVLAAITEYPDDWRVAAEFYGIANFHTLLQTTGPWRQVLRAAEYGDPVEDSEALESFSPIHRSDRIKVPLFIAHGLEDPRVPPGESEMMVSVLRGRGHPYEMVRVEGEGHGFQRQHNRLRVYGDLVRFLERHISIPEGQ
ncbi:MAG: prolyl aminopeptidase, partial [Pseudomonadota bacterium]